VKKKTPKPRNTYLKRVRSEASLARLPYAVKELAKYGRKVPGVFRVEYWQEALKGRTKTHGKFSLADHERDGLLSLFFGRFLALDDAWFLETAAAIQAYKAQATMPFDVEGLQLTSHIELWLGPPRTPEQIAAIFGWPWDPKDPKTETKVRRKLRDFGVPYKSGLARDSDK
jgi:hypothetical protein